MSDALSYLMKVRPDAMKSYFGFLKASGRHLDPRTRAIISVITKVDNQTSAGFKQYLKRALKEGVTPNEIIDALLTAFPSLGLTKIVWAMDLLLEMELPEFSLENLEPACAWHNIALMTDLDEEVTQIMCDDKELIIYHRDETIRVYHSHCPHQGTPIPVEGLNGYSVTCPKHGWCFDIRTGVCTAKGDRPLTEFEHKIENKSLLAYW